MAGRPGLFGGPRQGDLPDGSEDALGQNVLGNPPLARPVDPVWGDVDNATPPPGFDPVWGTLGAPPAPTVDPWLAENTAEIRGITIDVEVYGNGFQISGQLGTGQFDRLSDWLNMQTGFIQIRNALHVHLGHEAPAQEKDRGTLWIRLDQIVLIAERAVAQRERVGAPVVQKQRRKVQIVTPGYSLKANLHVVAYGSMQQFLESPDPHFLPITDVTVHWLEDPALVAHFPFAVINREQLVTILDQSSAPGGDTAKPEDEPMRESGAA